MGDEIAGEALVGSIATQNRRRRKPPWLMLIMVVVWPILAGGWLIKDLVDRSLRSPVAELEWVRVQGAVIRRLDQPHAPEWGAVWATRSGLTCGVVNGRFSFGGKTGMTPFYAELGRAPVFFFDMKKEAFAARWRDCQKSRWLTLREGSAFAGYCATREGQERCKPPVTAE